MNKQIKNFGNRNKQIFNHLKSDIKEKGNKLKEKLKMSTKQNLAEK